MSPIVTPTTFVGGIPFGLLYDAVKLAIHKSNKFKKQLANLKQTLDGLNPLIIQGIQDNNEQLDLPTETIQGIAEKMVEGKELMDQMEKLSVWNIRIWGNCCTTLGPDWTVHISKLDSDIKVLKDRLEMEKNKNITELVVVGKAYGEIVARLENKLDIYIEGQQQINDKLDEILKQQRSEASSSREVGGISLLPGAGEASSPSPVLGEVFQNLLETAKNAFVNNLMYRHLTERLKSTLFYIHPLIEEIAIHNKVLHLPEEEVKHLLKQLTDGAELVSKFSKIRRRAKYKENGDTIAILDLNCSLQRLVTRLVQEVETKIKKTTYLAGKIEVVINNFEDGNVGRCDDFGAKGGTTSPITAISIVESRLDQITEINVGLKQTDDIEVGDVKQFNDLGAKGGSASTSAAISIVDSRSDQTSSTQVDLKGYDSIEARDVEPFDDLAAEGGASSTTTVISTVESISNPTSIATAGLQHSDNIKDGDVEQFDDLGEKGGSTSAATAITIYRSRSDPTGLTTVGHQKSDSIGAEDGDVEKFDDLGAKGGSASAATAISIVESSSVLTSSSANSQVGFNQSVNVEVGDADIEESDDLRAKGGSASATSSTLMGLKQSDNKELFRRNNSSRRKKKTNEKPSKSKKKNRGGSIFCSCIKTFQEYNEETEMIVQLAFPEECIITIISLTTPADACRLSLVSKHFKSAAESDQVWENFLRAPHLTGADESQSASSSTTKPAKSKKELYLSLCDKPVLVDDGKMSFWLDKWSGKTCYMVCAEEISIVWAEAKSRYWSWIPMVESRFELVASLDEVCWLEIRGKIDMSILSPWTHYKAYLVYKLTNRHYGFDVPVEVAIAKRDYGFEYGPLEAAINGDENKQTVYLDPTMDGQDVGGLHPNLREDGWLEMELGRFECQGKEDGELEMMCAEYKNLCWKSGLIVEGLEVRPERKTYSQAKAKVHNKGKKKALKF